MDQMNWIDQPNTQTQNPIFSGYKRLTQTHNDLDFGFVFDLAFDLVFGLDFGLVFGFWLQTQYIVSLGGISALDCVLT